eukprot:scaffold42445_cov58-Phaeocystis_antarctica.AAC.3
MAIDGVRSLPPPWKGQRALSTLPACSGSMPYELITSTSVAAALTAAIPPFFSGGPGGSAAIVHHRASRGREVARSLRIGRNAAKRSAAASINGSRPPTEATRNAVRAVRKARRRGCRRSFSHGC